VCFFPLSTEHKKEKPILSFQMISEIMSANPLAVIANAITIFKKMERRAVYPVWVQLLADNFYSDPLSGTMMCRTDRCPNNSNHTTPYISILIGDQTRPVCAACFMRFAMEKEANQTIEPVFNPFPSVQDETTTTDKSNKRARLAL